MACRSLSLLYRWATGPNIDSFNACTIMSGFAYPKGRAPHRQRRTNNDGIDRNRTCDNLLRCKCLVYPQRRRTRMFDLEVSIQLWVPNSMANTLMTNTLLSVIKSFTLFYFEILKNPPPELVLGSCVLLGCCLSSFAHRRDEKDRLQSVVLVASAFWGIAIGRATGSSANLITLSLIPGAMCLAMLISFSGHEFGRWLVNRQRHEDIACNQSDKTLKGWLRLKLCCAKSQSGSTESFQKSDPPTWWRSCTFVIVFWETPHTSRLITFRLWTRNGVYYEIFRV